MVIDFKFYELGVVDSTIKFAKNYLDESNNLDSTALAFCAKSQTNGVGKMDKKWESKPGNLYLSVIFKPLDNYDWDSQLDINIFNLLASLTLLQTINKLCADGVDSNLIANTNYSINCKWPNDILINNAKVSGILLEKLIANKKPFLLVSFGVNITHKPTLNNYSTICLQDIKSNLNLAPLDMARLLITNIFNNASLPKTIIIKKWLAYAYKLNQEILVNIGSKAKKGIFIGLDDSGKLLLQNKDKIETISVGEVY